MSRAAQTYGWWPAGVAAVVLVLASVAILLDPRVRLLALNTVLLAAGTSAVALPIGTFLAWVLVRSNLPERRWVLPLVLLLLAVPLYLTAAGWQSGLGRLGLFSSLYEAQPAAVAPGELPATRPPLLDGWTGAIWVHAMAAIPWVVLIVGLGLSQVEPQLEEQALLDGSPLAVAWQVTLPRAGPSIAVAALWIFVTVASEMTVTDLFQVRTFAEEIYLGYARNPLDNVLDDAPVALLPGIAAVLVIVLAAGACAMYLAPLARDTAKHPPRSFELGGLIWPVRLSLVLMLLMLIGVPLASLVFKAGVGVSDAAGTPVRTWSVARALVVVGTSYERFWNEIGWTLVLGVAAATASGLAALPLAWWARLQSAGAAVILLVAALLLALPGPVMGTALIASLGQVHWTPVAWLYDHTILAPALALVLRTLPWCLLILWHAFRQIPDEQLDSAALDGAGPAGTLLRIALPQKPAGLAVAWLVAFLLATGDVSHSVLVQPPGQMTVAWQVFQLLHAGVEDYMAGICLAWMAICLSLGGLALYLWRRDGDAPYAEQH